MRTENTSISRIEVDDNRASNIDAFLEGCAEINRNCQIAGGAGTELMHVFLKLAILCQTQYTEENAPELATFRSDEFGQLRMVSYNGEPWFIGKDICDALGYSNSSKALNDHVDPEDKRQGDGVTIRDPMGRFQKPTIINESGLYSLILSSKLEGAKKFKRWVTSEVLPSIRKNGGYGMTPKTYPEALRALADLTEKRSSFGFIYEKEVKAAQEWMAKHPPQEPPEGEGLYYALVEKR